MDLATAKSEAPIEKLSDFGVKQILYRVDIALYVHSKNSPRSHLRAIMPLDHSR